ncbi:hypothetical protein RI367_005266 [Sorochytrium milnesiophthora]
MSLAPASLRRDHRLEIRIVEAKFPANWSEMDAYCSVRIGLAPPPSSPVVRDAHLAGLGSISSSGNGASSNANSNTVGSSNTAAAAASGSATTSMNGTAGKNSGRKMSIITRAVHGSSPPLPNQSASSSSSQPAHALTPLSSKDIMSSSLNSTSSSSGSSGGGGASGSGPGDYYYQSQSVYRTPVIWRARECAFWDHQFDIELSNDFKHIEVEVWSKRLLKDALIGSVMIPSYDLRTNHKPREAWYALRTDRDTDASSISSTSSATSHHNSSTASVRIRHLYTDEFILPLPVYKPLLNILVDPKTNVHLVQALDRTVEDRDETSRILLRIMMYMELHEQYLNALTAREVEATPMSSLLFRANSMASKSLDNFMKIVASGYLTRTLQPVIKGILADGRNCEIDPARLDKNENLEENFTILEAYLKWTTERILSSADDCPLALRGVFHALQQRVVERWPEDPQARYIAVSAFIFLRLFNAAILGPKLFNLSDQHPSSVTARTLTLLSKSMQQLANLLPFDGTKEPFMTPLNDYIHACVPRMKVFLDAVSVPPTPTPTPNRASPTPQTHSSLPLLQVVATEEDATSAPSAPAPLGSSQATSQSSGYLNTSTTNSTTGLSSGTPSIDNLSNQSFNSGSGLSAVPYPSARSSLSNLNSSSGEDGLAALRERERERDKPEKSPAMSRKGFLRKFMGHKDKSDRGDHHDREPSSGHSESSAAASSSASTHTRSHIPHEIIKSIDIELLLSALHRILVKFVDKMQVTCTDEEAPTINRLAILLREMTSILERRAQPTLGSSQNVNGVTADTVAGPGASAFARNNSGAPTNSVGAYPAASTASLGRTQNANGSGSGMLGMPPLPSGLRKSATTDSLVGPAGMPSKQAAGLLRKSGSSPLSASLARSKEDLLYRLSAGASNNKTSSANKISGRQRSSSQASMHPAPASSSNSGSASGHRLHATFSQQIQSSNSGGGSASQRHLVISSPILNSALLEKLQLSGGRMSPTTSSTPMMTTPTSEVDAPLPTPPPSMLPPLMMPPSPGLLRANPRTHSIDTSRAMDASRRTQMSPAGSVSSPTTSSSAGLGIEVPSPTRSITPSTVSPLAPQSPSRRSLIQQLAHSRQASRSSVTSIGSNTAAVGAADLSVSSTHSSLAYMPPSAVALGTLILEHDNSLLGMGDVLPQDAVDLDSPSFLLDSSSLTPSTYAMSNGGGGSGSLPRQPIGRSRSPSSPAALTAQQQQQMRYRSMRLYGSGNNNGVGGGGSNNGTTSDLLNSRTFDGFDQDVSSSYVTSATSDGMSPTESLSKLLAATEQPAAHSRTSSGASSPLTIPLSGGASDSARLTGGSE